MWILFYDILWVFIALSQKIWHGLCSSAHPHPSTIGAQAGYQVVATNELLGLGAANLAGAFCGAVPTQIGLSRMGAWGHRPMSPYSNIDSTALQKTLGFHGKNIGVEVTSPHLTEPTNMLLKLGFLTADWWILDFRIVFDDAGMLRNDEKLINCDQ